MVIIMRIMRIVCGRRLGVITGPGTELLGNMCGLVMRRVRHRVLEGGHQGATLHRKHRYFPPCFVSHQNTLHPSTLDFIIGPINNESFYCSHSQGLEGISM